MAKIVPSKIGYSGTLYRGLPPVLDIANRFAGQLTFKMGKDVLGIAALLLQPVQRFDRRVVEWKRECAAVLRGIGQPNVVRHEVDVIPAKAEKVTAAKACVNGEHNHRPQVPADLFGLDEQPVVLFR